MKKAGLLLLLLPAVITWGQSSGTFNVVVKKVKGDLNKDGKDDLVTVMQDAGSSAGTYTISASRTAS
ncbi:hypothetical protein [Taibaiella koreensis]|uniref:hypothetical protein n=1 Tax=Taibaiella koreensis TaxID=1268548 RepID=UPI0013C31DE9|nr:hypothetical protein [Taibaiella koreensis]